MCKLENIFFKNFFNCKHSIAGIYLYRVHVKPRRVLFHPADGDCPLPLKFLDVMRTTLTDLDHEPEAKPDILILGKGKGCKI